MPDGAPAATGDPHNLPDLQLRSDQRLSAAALMLMAAPALWFARYELAALVVFKGIDAAGALRLTLALIAAVAAALVQTARSREAYSRLVFQAALAITLCYGVASVIYGASTPLRAPLLAAAVMYVGLPNTLWRQVLPPLLMSLVLIATNSLPLPALADLPLRALFLRELRITSRAAPKVGSGSSS